MSVLTALYNTYNVALKGGLVDSAPDGSQDAILLPVYHTSKKSKGTDIIEVTLSEASEFVNARWLAKDEYAVFPVSEKSIARSSSTSAPHPLCDELSYTSSHFSQKKYADYRESFNEWLTYDYKHNQSSLLQAIGKYINRGDNLLANIINSLYPDIPFQINEQDEFLFEPDNTKPFKVEFNKVFVTYRLEIHNPLIPNQTVTNSKELHQNYIEYMHTLNSYKTESMSFCDISKEWTYCALLHRGIFGNAKLVSVSNNDETYFGRFKEGSEIIRIGFEASQKIHLMLKFLSENSENKQFLGHSSTLITWFSDDIKNTNGIKLTSSLEADSADDAFYDLSSEIGQHEADFSVASLGGSQSKLLNQFLSGKLSEFKQDSMFYVMIIDKISNGRVAIKYFRELPKSDIFERVAEWYKSTSWPTYDVTKGIQINKTPSLYQYANFIYGLEDEKSGFLECKNKKLRNKTVERLLPCIIDGMKFPYDMKQRALANIKKRASYDKMWNHAVQMGCSIFKKNNIDFNQKKEVKEVLDKENFDFSYLNGRLLAIYEKIEYEAMRTSDSGSSGGEGNTKSSDGRSTNAQRLWTSFTQTPGRTRMVLETKLRPYWDRLRKNRYGLYKYYESEIHKVTSIMSEDPNYTAKLNVPLNEQFLFGYYGQKQDFYKKVPKQDQESQEFETTE